MEKKRNVYFVTHSKKSQERGLKRKIMEKFIAYLKSKGLSKPTIKRYLQYYRLFEKDMDQEGLSQDVVTNFLMKHVSNTSRAFLKNILEMYGLERDYKIPKLTGRKKRVKKKFLTPEKANILRTWLYHNKNIRYLLCFDLSYYCALRRAEVLAIDIHDFDFDNWIKDKEKPCRLKIHGKGDRERYVVVPPKLLQRIISYLKDHKSITERLFPFNYTIWHEAFKEAVKGTMDYNFTLHDLRRARATQWMHEGIDVVRIKNRLGHTNISSTILYINPDEEKELTKWEEEYV